MAILKVLTYGDELLRQSSKDVHKVSSKIQKIVDDLYATMYAYNGVGLAAAQVGINYNIFVIDTATEEDPADPITFINPKIVRRWGAVNSYEGCLSFPEAYTYVKRYENVIVRAKDRKGKTFTLEAKDGCLLSRAIQHESDHLEGTLFIDHANNRFETDQILTEQGLPEIQAEYLIEEPELEHLIAEKQVTSFSEAQDGNKI